MELIRKLNEQFKVKDPVELALESVANPQRDMARIADYWREKIEMDSTDPDEQMLIDAIGDDLEQLEYSPEDVERMVPQVMQMVLGR